MSDLSLRKAVAKAAGWTWKNSKHLDDEYATDGQGRQRLHTYAPLSLDDVFAACEAAGIRFGEWQWFKGGCHVKVRKSHEEWVEEWAGSLAEALARALCAACGVEIEDV